MSEHIRDDLDLLHRSLLDGKLPRNLSWNEAVELIQHLGTAEPHGGDQFAFVVGTQKAFFKKPHNHELGVEEVSRLRKFLKEAGPNGNTSNATQPHRIIVVIDHHAAHLYQDLNGSRPEDEVTVRPYDPFHFHHHLIHRKESHYRGEHVPEEASFYDEIAKELIPANEIVPIGHGNGKSSAVEFLMTYLKTHHAEIAQRVRAVERRRRTFLRSPSRKSRRSRRST
jgi:hypothetical protein